ncbi:MAG TPA: hypothetical protein VH092_03220 [Urbifossiella sp.]|jgi:hypothetical protein|nr:hypothetical protein [Urbifossiella sp.]
MPKATRFPTPPPPNIPPNPPVFSIIPLTERNDKATSALETLYDSLNEQLVAAEARLRALKPLRSASVSYEEWSDRDQIRYWQELALIKIDGKWRLVHAECNEVDSRDPDNGPDFRPITERTGEVRLRAAKEVRPLFEKIVKQKEEMVTEVESAIRELAEICIDF